VDSARSGGSCNGAGADVIFHQAGGFLGEWFLGEWFLGEWKVGGRIVLVESLGVFRCLVEYD
jgi:hypothetical protein